MGTKSKKKRKNLGLDAFPSLGLDSFPSLGENSVSNLGAFPSIEAETVEIENSQFYGTNPVPQIPNSFYQNPPLKQDSLMEEINKLNDDYVFIDKDKDISIYLQTLQTRINADRTWFAMNHNEENTFRMIDSRSNSNESLSIDNELVSHAMSIDHLMLVKNKMYIDNLLDNTDELTSLFIVPINTTSSHGMLLAGYKKSQTSIDEIVMTLDKSKGTLASFL